MMERVASFFLCMFVAQFNLSALVSCLNLSLAVDDVLIAYCQHHSDSILPPSFWLSTLINERNETWKGCRANYQTTRFCGNIRNPVCFETRLSIAAYSVLLKVTYARSEFEKKQRNSFHNFLWKVYRTHSCNPFFKSHLIRATSVEAVFQIMNSAQEEITSFFFIHFAAVEIFVKNATSNRTRAYSSRCATTNPNRPTLDRQSAVRVLRTLDANIVASCQIFLVFGEKFPVFALFTLS